MPSRALDEHMKWLPRGFSEREREREPIGFSSAIKG